jgi:hypothetical protein
LFVDILLPVCAEAIRRAVFTNFPATANRVSCIPNPESGPMHPLRMENLATHFLSKDLHCLILQHQDIPILKRITFADQSEVLS